mmetsp:Transcript_51117/g.94605  ORF Transcript_51117/g.94605 Transcript_51117/m.94605 type:complete len:221 (+) Transcript_51117:394-1056(+)
METIHLEGCTVEHAQPKCCQHAGSTSFVCTSIVIGLTRLLGWYLCPTSCKGTAACLYDLDHFTNCKRYNANQPGALDHLVTSCCNKDVGQHPYANAPHTLHQYLPKRCGLQEATLCLCSARSLWVCGCEATRCPTDVNEEERGLCEGPWQKHQKPRDLQGTLQLQSYQEFCNHQVQENGTPSKAYLSSLPRALFVHSTQLLISLILSVQRWSVDTRTDEA